ncbi:MAG TPA: amino acid adenylation domain-containing protein, partial [Pyrinomonadaceae bacterium]|nr:amino acid adenylation domain-containing protein [Pyrinomonadaceae bacterium]
EQSFRELLQLVRETALNAYAHRELPFDTLVEHLQPDRSLSHHPLFQVLFVVQNTPAYSISLPGLTISAEPFNKSAAQFDLVISVTEANREFVVATQYSTDLFDEATIKDLLQHLRTLLASVVTNPESRLADLPLITDDERQFLTKQLNNTHAPYPEAATIQELFEKQLELDADSIALIDEEGRQLSYDELNRRSNQLAHHLISLGVGPESLVGVVMDRSLESTISLLGILKAGGAYVPLDASYPKDRLAYMLRNSGAEIIMTKSRFVDSLPEHAAHVIRIDDHWIEISQQSTDNPPPRSQPQHPAYIIYTSGSTGQPKGVLGLHRGAVNRFHWMWATYAFGAEEVCCQKTSLSFVDAVWEVFGPLLQGVPTVIFSDDVVKDTERFIDALSHHGVTRIVLVPSLLRVMLDAREIGVRLAKLKYCVCSGEALPADLAQLFQQRLPHCRLLNLYGSSEVSADATYHELAQGQTRANVAIGRPLSNVQIYILDEHLRPLPAGAKGELYVGGDALARGYLGRPDLTAAHFIPDVAGERAGARLYRTGDLARRLADGTIEYLGRADHQVKIRGYRIELEEIESVLKQHEAVREAVVHAHADAATGLRLTAYIVAEEPDERTINGCREHLRERLPDYMMPAGFVLMDALPLTPNGKVDRHALPVPQKTADVEKGFQPPRNPTEREIVEIWSELLGLERVGVEDNFFELGGHSLLATQMISRIRMNFGVELDVKKFFLRPTITTLAEVVEQKLFAGADQATLAEMLEAIDDLREEEAQRLALGN